MCLTAPPEMSAARVAAREPDRWPGKADLVARSRILARTVPAVEGIDVTIASDATDAEGVAIQVRAAMGRHGLLDAVG